jgi:succinate-semialdehyde dehydrogenase / glutarate-semialdehyde dehydrogenase
MKNDFTLAGAPFAIATDLLINGQWVEAADKKRVPVFNPASGEILAQVADCGVADAVAAMDAAERSAPFWRAMSPRARCEILRRCYERMIASADWLATLVSLENGKILSDAKAEILYSADFFRWYSEEGVRLLGDVYAAPGGAHRILVEYQPVGISLLLTPWNFPAAMAARKIAPALAAGCTVVLKPAMETPLTAFAISQLMMEVGLPPGVLNILTTDRPAPLSDAILHDPRLRKLSFTGSTQVGRGLLKLAADQVISCSMELGGNAPFLVMEGAHLPEALDGAMAAKMRGGGEVCIAANRFYVHRSLNQGFTDGMVQRMGALVVGEGTDPKTTLGPMINQKAIDKIARLVDDAVARGGRLLLGGTRLNRPGTFYPPTVIADVPDDAHLLKEEIFGPVVAIQSFDTAEEAIAKANNTEYGLASYLYAADLKQGLQLAEKIEAGMVAINRGLMSDPAAPFGGVKQSGLGREGAHHGLLEFTECKYIAVNW